jgi:hypothetical protein
VQSGPPAKAFVRAVIALLLSKPEWSAYEKAVVWETFAVDFNDFPGIIFGSNYHLGTDGSHLFTGPGGYAIIFRPDGKIFRGIMIFLKPLDPWKANFTMDDYRELELLNP